MKKTIFREYDIRGQVNDQEINPENLKLIGKAFAVYLQKRGISEVVIGYDYRSYSFNLKENLKSGLLSSGCKVIDIGLCLTPMLYFAQYYFQTLGGAIITASHNPNGWSGIKLSDGYSQSLMGIKIQEIYQIIQKQQFINQVGTLKEESITEAYTQAIIKTTNKVKYPFKIVVECGNGTAGKFVPTILRQIGCQVIEIFCDLDDNFPHHNPNPEDPLVKKLLSQKVLEEKADLGVSFDGDGDRLGAVDDQGSNIWPDRLLILLASQILKDKPGAKIIFDVKCTQILEEEILKQGGIPIICRTGNPYIKEKLFQEKADLAGERSGHIFIKQGWYGFDDAIMATIKLLQYLLEKNQSLSTINKAIPQYPNTPTLSIPCNDDKKNEIVSSIVKEFKQEYGSAVIDIDGAKVRFKNGWGLIKVSNTEPKITLNFEAKTNQELEKIKNIFQKKLAKYHLSLECTI